MATDGVTVAEPTAGANAVSCFHCLRNGVCVLAWMERWKKSDAVREEPKAGCRGETPKGSSTIKRGVRDGLDTGAKGRDLQPPPTSPASLLHLYSSLTLVCLKMYFCRFCETPVDQGPNLPAPSGDSCPWIIGYFVTLKYPHCLRRWTMLCFNNVSI